MPTELFARLEGRQATTRSPSACRNASGWSTSYARGGEGAAVRGAWLAAVGRATAARLRARGCPALGASRGRARRRRRAGPRGSRRRISSTRRRPDRSSFDALRRRDVGRGHAYVAEPPRAHPKVLAAVRAGEIDAVTFTSSSTVRNLVTLLDGDIDALRGAVVACIGPQTAKAAVEAGLPPQVVADEPSVDALVGALRRYAAEEA